MKKNFTKLPTHNGATIQFYFYQIDDYNADPANPYTVYFKINDKVIPYNISPTGYNICGNSSYDSLQKLTISDPTHNNENLIFEVHGNRVKFGVSDMLVMLKNCADCASNTVTYELETIPMYSAENSPDSTEKGLKSKITFSD